MLAGGSARPEGEGPEGGGGGGRGGTPADGGKNGGAEGRGAGTISYVHCRMGGALDHPAVAQGRWPTCEIVAGIGGSVW